MCEKGTADTEDGAKALAVVKGQMAEEGWLCGKGMTDTEYGAKALQWLRIRWLIGVGCVKKEPMTPNMMQKHLQMVKELEKLDM